MLVECTVHIGGARLITIRQLASLVQLFLLKAEDFSLAFLFSSTSTYRISRSQPYRVCQTWLLEGAERAARTRWQPGTEHRGAGPDGAGRCATAVGVGTPGGKDKVEPCAPLQ